MVDIIRGASKKPISTKQLIEYVDSLDLKEAILYTGYPIVGLTDDLSSLDAMLISAEHGIIVFDVVEEPTYSDRSEIRDVLYNVILQRLIGNRELTVRRGQLKAKIEVLTIAPSWQKTYKSKDVVVDEEDFVQTLESLKQPSLIYTDYKKLVQAIQAITKLKSRPPRKTSLNSSKGALLNELEKSIANLDRRQSKAVIETVDGVQRIRGLAGSGKTIVLALKVAYLHSKFPDWTIGVTYYTRSLKSQFIELITKFTIEHKNEEPDWGKVKIQQAWGSPKDNGFYFEFCKVNNVEYLDYESAKEQYGSNANFIDKLSSKALLDATEPKAIYDAILIDEAQDFTEAFLKLCYSLLKPASPKNEMNRRLIYAYDELQKLNDSNTLKNPKHIFPEIDFENESNKPQQDIILEKCYRNSVPVLVTAHALGFGIYRDNNQLVTMFSDLELWKDVGYKVDSGRLAYGEDVVLVRDQESSLEFLTDKTSSDEIIQFLDFKTPEQQTLFVAESIINDLQKEDLNYKDIIVVHPNPLKAKNDLAPLRQLLFEKGFESHLAGVSTSKDEFFIDGSIAFTSIYRAKGNEAAMVYIVDAQYCFGGYELIKKRNTLFTAITRSKAWVRVCGVGEKMMGLKEEFNKVKENNFKLKFRYPTLKEMDTLNVLHRDLTDADKKAISESEKEASSLLSRLKSNQILLGDLSKDTIEELRRLLNDDK